MQWIEVDEADYKKEGTKEGQTDRSISEGGGKKVERRKTTCKNDARKKNQTRLTRS